MDELILYMAEIYLLPSPVILLAQCGTGLTFARSDIDCSIGRVVESK